MYQATFISTYTPNPSRGLELPLGTLHQLHDFFSRIKPEPASDTKSPTDQLSNLAAEQSDDPPASMDDLLSGTSSVHSLALTPRLWRIPIARVQQDDDPLALRPIQGLPTDTLALTSTGWAVAYVPFCGVALLWHFRLELDYRTLCMHAADLHHYLADTLHHPELSSANAALNSALSTLHPQGNSDRIVRDLSAEDLHTILWLTHPNDIPDLDLARLTARRSHLVQPEVIRSPLSATEHQLRYGEGSRQVIAITPGCTVASNVTSRWAGNLLMAAITATCLAAQARSIYKMLSDDLLTSLLSQRDLPFMSPVAAAPVSTVDRREGPTAKYTGMQQALENRAAQLANLELYAALIPARFSIRPVIPIRLVSRYYGRLIDLLEVAELYRGAAALLERSRRALENVVTEVDASVQQRQETRARIVATVAALIATLAVPAHLLLAYLGVNVRPFGRVMIDDPSVTIAMSAAVLLAMGIAGLIGFMINRGASRA